MKRLGPLVRVINAQPIRRFVVRVSFADGTVKEIDLAPFLHGPMFEALRNDPALFRAMRIAGNTIAWENGADIDPDVLYYDLKPAWQAEETETAR